VPGEVPLSLPKFLNWQQNELNDNKNYNNGGLNILCFGSCQVQAIAPGKVPLSLPKFLNWQQNELNGMLHNIIVFMICTMSM
jgi:hypothetical protein